ncbi:MAG: sulfoxide reductase heme-binding subunit YedZ [Chloroflexi bacterium]|nr:sulfoxide reductase heme-binding subunit YedZ [Chloroflexota bacterium]
MRRSDGLIHVLALAPLVWIVFDQLTGQRSINPIQTWTQRSGFSALALLLASLACTPANRIAGVRRAAAWRRPLGLYGFGYALIHVLIFVVIDYAADGSAIMAELAEKRYLIVGALAFAILIPLALTSTAAWQRRLGRQWRRMHRMVYLAVPLAVVHQIWQAKSDIRLAVLFALVTGLVLLMRLPPTTGARRR